MKAPITLMRAGIAAACLVTALAQAAGTHRFHRPLTAESGWVRAALPDDVLDNSKPTLSDIRIFSDGNEVPYALEESLAPADARLEFANVESTPGKETTALLDRGEHASLGRALEFVIAEPPPFLKPVIVESSNDRLSFSRIARTSIFATAQSHQLLVAFAPNDSRYLRVRFDDRQSSPVHPTAAIVHQPRVWSDLRNVPLKFSLSSSDAGGNETYAIELPSANLLIATLAIETRAAAFSRTARVYETVMFRGELSRRLIRETTIQRAPGGEERLEVPIDEVVGKRLEVEVEHAGSRLSILAFTARARPRALLFYAPTKGTFDLAYGSALAQPPTYDIATALANARPNTWVAASLGHVTLDSDVAALPSFPQRGQVIASSDWNERQSIQLPSTGSLAVLDLPPEANDHLASVRIVDPSGAQVPYVVESEPRRTLVRLEHTLEVKGGQTRIDIPHLPKGSAIERLSFEATGPAFFERTVTVKETVTDARGVTGERTLATGIWERAPGEKPAPFTLSIERPSSEAITAVIDDGDNAPIAFLGVSTESTQRRIDFAFSRTDKLSLLWDNPKVSAPRYDVALLSNTILSSQALPATLGPLQGKPAETEHTPKWFWWAASLAGIIVAGLLGRTLLAPTRG